MPVVEIITPREIDEQLTRLADGINNGGLKLIDPQVDSYKSGADQAGVYVSSPGPSATDTIAFLPFSLAISFFVLWTWGGTGSPFNMVRLMAFKDSKTLHRGMVAVAVYYSLIYFPIVIIFCCARVLLPGMEAQSDEIMPTVAVVLTRRLEMSWLAGMLMAAPFAAVMSTVDSALLMISSALVRDLYQRSINPRASEKFLRRLSYTVTFVIGSVAVCGAVNPPQYLLDMIIYTGSGLAACFLAPMVFALYWPRTNTIGAITGMIAGFLTHLAMYGAGWLMYDRLSPYRLLQLDPTIVGLAVSFVTVYAVSRTTAAPSDELVDRYFHKQKTYS